MPTDKMLIAQIAGALAQQADTLNRLIEDSATAGEYRGEWEHLRDELARVQGVALRALHWARG